MDVTNSPVDTENHIVEEAEDLSLDTEMTDAAAEEPSWEEKHQVLWDQHVRLAADFDNFRKRTAQERDNLRRFGMQQALEALFPALDNLERAQKSLSENSDPKTLYQSFRLVSNQLVEGFTTLGIQRIKAIGEPFDPNFHEAVAQVPGTGQPDGTVIEEQQAGYVLQDQVIRPALVIVAQESTDAAEDVTA